MAILDIVQVAQEHPVAAFSLSALLFVAVCTLLTPGQVVPKALPWLGRRDGTPFATTRASFSSIRNFQTWLEEGYQNYNRKGKSYIFPSLAGHHEVVIPNNRLKWLLDHSDNVVSSQEAHAEDLNAEYAFTSSKLLADPFHQDVIHKFLPRKVDNIIPSIHDEIVTWFDEAWGTQETDTWSEVPVFEGNMDLISRVTNRMFVGLPLCRNQGFLKHNSAFATSVIVAGMIIQFFPKVLRPLFGHIICIPNYYHYWCTRKYTLPLIKQRLADVEAKDKDPDSKIQIPDDYVTWHIRLAQMQGRKQALEPDMISRYLMPIEFAAIHTTSLSLAMVMFDLFSSDPKNVTAIREECERVLQENGGVWNKQSLSKLIRTDSAIRESMRVSNFQVHGAQRKVVKKDGLEMVEEGWTAPYGTRLCVDQQNRHHDPQVYPDPLVYDAFRFSRPREEYEASLGSEAKPQEYLKMRNLSMISTGENFLPFGHGRHACPGRFLVQHELKMIIAYIVMNYEVEQFPTRPPNEWVARVVLPPMKTKLRIRRRGAVSS